MTLKQKMWTLAFFNAVVFLILSTVAVAAGPKEAVLRWVAVTKDTDGGTITGVKYNVYQGKRGQAKTDKKRTEITTLTTTITNLPAGEFCWEVTAVLAGVESARSAEACKTIKAAAPLAPTISIE